MEVYTIGFTQKSAEEFFGILIQNNIRRLIDVRLNNTNQLTGFSKRNDLAYFLKSICEIDYIHETSLAPTKDILDEYKKRQGSWQEYEVQFLDLMAKREIDKKLGRDLFAERAVLLCSEPTAEYCHRRLVLEYLQTKWEPMSVVHL